MGLQCLIKSMYLGWVHFQKYFTFPSLNSEWICFPINLTSSPRAWYELMSHSKNSNFTILLGTHLGACEPSVCPTLGLAGQVVHLVDEMSPDIVPRRHSSQWWKHPWTIITARHKHSLVPYYAQLAARRALTRQDHVFQHLIYVKTSNLLMSRRRKERIRTITVLDNANVNKSVVYYGSDSHRRYYIYIYVRPRPARSGMRGDRFQAIN